MKFPEVMKKNRKLLTEEFSKSALFNFIKDAKIIVEF